MPVKKQWYEIIAPKMFGERVVGDTLAVDPKHLIGRKITVNLTDIVNDYNKFYVKLIFQIERVEGTKAYTKFTGHDIMRERVYRLVQRRGRRVDCIQDVRTKDGVKMRVKTVFMLIRRVGTSMKRDARKMAHAIIEETAKESNFEDFMKMILEAQLQQKIRKSCSKLYPTGNVEIRKTEVKS
jgi:small subunit ribosomal protein S3Ae